MPGRFRDSRMLRHDTGVFADNSGVGEQKKLDCGALCDIIVFTEIRGISPEGAHAQQKKQARKTPRPATAGNPQPPSRGGHGRAVPGQRILRCQGLAPGQARDAAPRRSGTGFGEPNRRRVRSLPPVVLPGTVGLRASWPHRPDPAETRATPGAQADCPGHGIYPAISNSPAVAADRGTGATGPGTLRRAGPCSKHPAQAFPPAKKRR